MSDFAHEITLLVVFENVRRGIAIDRAAGRGRARMIQHHEVSLGIDGHGQHLSQVPVGSNFQERHGFKWKVGNVHLRERRHCQQGQQGNHAKLFHGASKIL